MKENNKVDWHTCDHKWITRKSFLMGGRGYRFECEICGIYSYVGPAYDNLPDKSKSVFLHGVKENGSTD
jgi:hypothetical protein